MSRDSGATGSAARDRPRRSLVAARLRRAWSLFCPTLGGLEPGTREALEAHSRELTARNLALTGWLVGTLALAVWPTDFLLYAPDSPELNMLLRWRVMLLGTTLGMVALLRFAPWARRHAYAIALGVYAVSMGASAWLNAGLGDLRSPFFYGVYTAPLMTVLLAVRPLPRAAAILVVVGTYLAVFFGARPEALADPMAGAVFVWLGASSVTAQVAGSALYYLLGVRFLQERMLNEQQSELRELDRLRRVFFANISHELRTPLTNILGALRGLEAGDATRDAADVGLRNAARLRGLVDDLLSLARFDRAAPPPEPKLVDMAALAEGVVAEFRFPGGHRLALQADTRPLWARADPLQLRSALTNLLSNATKFSAPRDGPVSVRVGRARSDSGYLEIEVEDHGVGIPPGERPHLFDRFYQGQRRPGEARAGAGIGLALVREIVDAHGGTVRVRSEPGRGATFTIRLPDVRGAGAAPSPDEVAAQASACEGEPDDRGEGARGRERTGRSQRAVSGPAATPASAQAGSTDDRPDDEPDDGRTRFGHRPLVLVAEDDADLSDYVARTLSRRFRAVQARDGREALDRARASHPAAIVSDIRMPRMDGWELLRAVRGDPQLAETPVLLLTAHAGPKDAPDSLAAGADEFLVKPFDEDELLERVELLVARSAREQELSARIQEATDALRRSAGNLVATQEAERQRLARDLHDQVGPLLLGLRVELETIRRLDAASAARLSGLLDDLQRCFRGTLDALKPPGLEQRGVFSALRSLGREVRDRHGLACEVLFHADAEELSEAQELAVYRIAQEALTNVVRHASARRATVSFEEDRRPGWRLLRVADDGVGWPGAAAGAGGVGLVGMRERALLLGGELTVRAAAPRGTEVVARFPLLAGARAGGNAQVEAIAPPATADTTATTGLGGS